MIFDPKQNDFVCIGERSHMTSAAEGEGVSKC